MPFKVAEIVVEPAALPVARSEAEMVATLVFDVVLVARVVRIRVLLSLYVPHGLELLSFAGRDRRVRWGHRNRRESRPAVWDIEYNIDPLVRILVTARGEHARRVVIENAIQADRCRQCVQRKC